MSHDLFADGACLSLCGQIQIGLQGQYRHSGLSGCGEDDRGGGLALLKWRSLWAEGSRCILSASYKVAVSKPNEQLCGWPRRGSPGKRSGYVNV